MAAQPSGTVTLVFTDIEGSTRLLERLGQAAYREALAEHRRVVREAFGRREGYEVDYEGDAFFYAFASAPAAVDAVAEAMRGLAGGPIRIRVGVHTGEPGLDPPKYVGADVHRAARIMSAGHGGQVLLSQETLDRLDGAAVTDLGEHRLKDFDEPVALFQLGDERFPPLRTISSTNLPRPASSFVGREREVGEVVTLIRGGARLVTLTGPGGSGKTRLAIEAAAELVPTFKAGVFWVGLAAVREPALVLETVAQTLGAKDELAAFVRERELLLLLDNLEQVVDAASDLAVLVEACPNLVVLVTSRELLRVRGEAEYAVPPLSKSEAVELFCARARVEPSAAVEALCRRLDDLPLALELAAARASVLTVEQILERLGQRLDLFRGGRDADPRQQTLRATIEWSYDLLSAEERALFARMAVFVGGCTLAAAEAVCGADLDSLQALVEKSLVRRTGDRFWMLETIREYAAEQLQRGGEEDVYRRRHLDRFVALAEEIELASRGGDRSACFDRLEADHDNLRAAIAHAAATGEPGLEARLAAALWRFWAERGHVSEGSRRLDEALAGGRSQPLAVRMGRCYLGTMTSRGFAEVLAEAEAIAVAASGEDDRFTRIQALNVIGMMVGNVTLERSEEALREAIALSGGAYPAEEAEAIGWLLIGALYGPLPSAAGIARCREFERSPNRKAQAFAAVERSALEAMRGEFATARSLLAEGRAILRELNLKVFEANTAQEGYFVHMLAGEPDAAVADLRVACDLLAEMGERGFLSTVAGYLAHACAACGDRDEAERYAGLCFEAAAPDDRISQGLWRSALAKLLASRGELEPALRHARDGVEAMRRTDDINTLADRLADLAEVCRPSSRGEAGAEALGEALALYERKGNLVAAARTRVALGQLALEQRA